MVRPWSWRWVFCAVLLAASVADRVWALEQASPEFQVNTYTTSSQILPAVASDSAGNFVVV